VKKDFWFWLLLTGNIIGTMYGFISYYGRQIMETPFLLRIFVPDCPMHSLWFAVALVFLKYRKKVDLFFYLGVVGGLKYGFWTMFVLIRHYKFYFGIDFIQYLMIFIGHAFLFTEQFIFAGKFRVKNSYLLAGLCWFIMNDISDYYLGTHPYLPQGSLGFMKTATIVMSLSFSWLAFYLFKRLKKPLIEVT